MWCAGREGGRDEGCGVQGGREGGMRGVVCREGGRDEGCGVQGGREG